VSFSITFTAYELKTNIEDLESVVIFTSVENAKYFDEIIENFNSGKREKLKTKAIFVTGGIHIIIFHSRDY
jgi:uroporphyrinogen-III synthase